MMTYEEWEVQVPDEIRRDPLNDLIAQNPPCDLAVVRFRKREPPRCILVATVGGPHAGLAVELAISQARQFEAESGEPGTITLLHVVTDEADAVAWARAERLFEQRVFGSIPERVARETTKTVIMTKRYWRLKSLLGRVTRARPAANPTN
jgi:hypothetical protein